MDKGKVLGGVMAELEKALELEFKKMKLIKANKNLNEKQHNQ